MTLPRVVLVEDDAHVRRFVQLALDGLEVDLIACATLADARRALDAGAPSVVLTDLRLPDGSGLELLAWLQARTAAQSAACRTVVFSGGIDPSTTRQLETLQVWRVLHKPASVGALMACVEEALQSLPARAAPALDAPAAPVDPVAEFFGGDRALYAAYRQACVAQFARDVAAGDQAVSAGDCAALRRVAHNLKSVLTMLGEAEAAQWARSTEELAAAEALDLLRDEWSRTRQAMQRLVSQA